jgi:hypothetical protein
MTGRKRTTAWRSGRRRWAALEVGPDELRGAGRTAAV